MAKGIWLLWSQLLQNCAYSSTLPPVVGASVCCVPVPVVADGWRDIGGQEKAVIPGKMAFCRTGLCLDPCWVSHWGLNTKPRPTPWSPMASTASQLWANLSTDVTSWTGETPLWFLLRFEPQAQWSWVHERSVKCNTSMLPAWNSISQVATWQVWVGWWFSEDCKKATEWVAVRVQQKDVC